MNKDCNYIIRDQEFLSEIILNISKKIVAKYISLRVIPNRERQDVEMALVEKFLQQKDKINENFEGKAKLTTYFTAILNRMCCEIIRKEKKHWFAVIEEKEQKGENQQSTVEFETEKKLLIAEEIERLRLVLILLRKERAKVILFLKYYFDIPVSSIEIKEFSDNPSIVQIFSIRRGLSKTEVFENLARVVYLTEGKKIGGDAVRMWLKKQIDIIIEKLNSNNSTFHNNDSLGYLLEIQKNS